MGKNDMETTEFLSFKEKLQIKGDAMITNFACIHVHVSIVWQAKPRKYRGIFEEHAPEN